MYQVQLARKMAKAIAFANQEQLIRVLPRRFGRPHVLPVPRRLFHRFRRRCLLRPILLPRSVSLECPQLFKRDI